MRRNARLGTGEGVLNKRLVEKVKVAASLSWRPKEVLGLCMDSSKSAVLWKRQALWLCLVLLGAAAIIFPPRPVSAAGNPKVKGEIRLAWQSTRGAPEAEIEVRLEIAKGWHINSHQPSESYLVPTQVSFTTPPGVEVEKVRYPEPVMRSLSFAAGKLLSLYQGEVTISARVGGELKPASVIRAIVDYQACSDTVCLRPASLTLELPMGAAKVGDQGAGLLAERPTGMVEGWIEAGGYLYALVAVFLLGLALNLTPCVYPLISVTVAYFGGQSRGKKRRWVLAGCYVLGICVTFSVMGVSAALSGGFFGAALQKPSVLLGISAVLLVLAASNFGLYQFRVPALVAGRAGRAAGGAVGALFMGLTMGIIAAPCIGPIVVGLLLFVGARQDPLVGLLFFGVLGLGLGLPYLFLAVATDALHRLPRSGHWLEWMEKLFGFVLVGMAVYFAAPVFGRRFAALALPAVIAAAGVYLGFIFGGFGRRGKLAQRGVGVAACAVAVWLVIPGRGAETVQWTEFTPELVAAARQEERPAIVDFTADWCLPCREMERSTFADEEITREARRFLMLRADVTATSKKNEAWMSMFSVNGVPTIIFLRPDGGEEARTIGFVGREEFLELMRKTGRG